MSIASDGERLALANSLAGQVLVLQPSGAIDAVLTLEKPAIGSAPRPIGVAFAGDDRIVVSDANNHRVVVLGLDGRLLNSFGTGTRAGGSDGLNVPGGLAIDGEGYIYVVDTLNGRVVKLTPEAAFVRDFARLADTAGSLARPKGVAVDAAGRIFVSDGLQAAIEVFDADGEYLGVIGRRDAEDPALGSVFEAPSGLELTGDRMLVVDAVLGLIELQLPAPERAEE
jgi:sugar lactone lactonase YvrE